jgi:hypothetical protein
LSAGSTVTFETDAVLTDIKTSAVRDVVSITSAGSSSTIVLNAIDLTIEPGQLIYEGSSVRGRVASVEFSGASGGTTTVTTAAAVSDVIAGDDLVFKTFATNLTPTATATIRNVWTTEVDLSGVLTAGRDHTVSFTEGQATGTPIAASSASLDNQAVFIKSIVVTLSNPTDKVSSSDAAATAEKLILDPAYVTPLLGRGITFARTSNDHVLTLSAINQSVGVTASDMQLALRAVQYTNSSDNPSVTPRLIDVTVTDTTNETGIPARTTIGIVPVNDAPTLGGDFAATVLEGGAYTLTTGDLLPADIDNDPLTLRYEVASTPSTITVFRDINGDGQVDAGETLVPRVSTIVNGLEVTTTPGQEFTHAEVVGGIIKIRQDGSD